MLQNASGCVSDSIELGRECVWISEWLYIYLQDFVLPPKDDKNYIIPRVLYSSLLNR